jgi:hypothetical protein
MVRVALYFLDPGGDPCEITTYGCNLMRERSAESAKGYSDAAAKKR